MGRFPQPDSGKGSLRDIQVLVNDFPHLANQRITAELGLSEALDIEWVSPTSTDDFAEYRDAAFLQRLGLDRLVSPLADFWPANGPQWDALGLSADGSVFLVEAKANIPEAKSPGTAAKAGSASRAKIEAALAETKQFLGSSSLSDWSHTFYQYTNRLAHLHFLRRQKPLVNAYLVFVYFVGDTSVDGPATKEEWLGAIKIIKNYLGIDRKHRLAPYILDLYIDVAEIGPMI